MEFSNLKKFSTRLSFLAVLLIPFLAFGTINLHLPADTEAMGGMQVDGSLNLPQLSVSSVLFTDGSSNAATSSGLLFDGTTLTATGATIDGSFLVSSTTKPSVPFPRMSDTQMNAITPLSAGYMVWNNNAQAPYYASGAWHQFASLDGVETLTNKSLNFSSNTATNLPLTTAVTGVLPIANGGTNNGSLAVTAGGAVYTDGSKLVNIGAGVSGQVFTSGGSGAATWKPAGGAGSGINLLQNFNWNAELGATTNWTNSGGTFAVDSTAANVANGTYAFTFTASASGQTVLSNLTAIPAGLYGQNCLLEFYQKGFDANMTAQVTDGTNVIATRVLTAASGYTLQDMNFICPSSGSLQMKLISTAASAQGWFDEVHLGSADNLAQVSQASLVGQISVTGCSWSTSSTSFTNFTATTGCTYTVLAGSGVSAPSTMIPAITFASLAPGNYTYHVEGRVQNTTANDSSYFRISDGTNVSPEISQLQSSSGLPIIPGFQQTIAYTTAQSNITLQIQAKTDSGGAAGVQGVPLVISVYRFPTSSQLAINPNIGPASWNGTQSGAQWTTTSSTFVDGTVSGTPIITTITSRNLTCTQNGTLSGISCALPKPGIYQVCFGSASANATSGNHNYIQLTDGTTPFGFWDNTPQGSGSLSSIGGCTNYLATSNSISLKVQISTNAATTMTLSSSTAKTFQNWTVVALDQSLPAPYYVGSVVNQGGGIFRMATVNMTAVCSTSPCTLAKSTGISSVTRSAGGTYLANFSPPFNGLVESCTVSTSNPNSVAGENCRLDTGGTSSSQPVFCDNSVTGTGTDAGFNLTCFGDN